MPVKKSNDALQHATGFPASGPVVFRLPPELLSVSHARSKLAQLVGEWQCPHELRHDAGLVLSELMSNGVLHARTELEVTLSRLDDGGIRIEVRDASGAPVIPPLGHPEVATNLLDEHPDEWDDEMLAIPAATGRGLAMVGALSRSWGWFPEGGGKVVWAELAAVAGAEPVTGGRFSEGSNYAVRPVRLIAIPVRLLKGSEDHFDDLFRELQMAQLSAAPESGHATGGQGAGAEAAETGGLSEAVEVSGKLAELADTVRGRLARMREPVRKAIWDAAHRGDRILDINVLADAGMPAVFDVSEEMLSQAARAARLGMLLTEPPAPEVVAWRRWLRQEMETQIAGRPPRACPFPVWPQVEIDITPEHERLSAARGRAVAELRALLARSASESGKSEASRLGLEAVLGYTGGCRAILCLLADDNETVTLGASVGFSADVLEYWQNYSLSADLPGSEVIRTGKPLVFRTLAELHERFPVFTSSPSETDPSIACLPLIPDGETAAVGCVVVGFPQARDFGSGEIAFLKQLAQELGDFVSAQRRAQIQVQTVQRERALAGARAAMVDATNELQVFRSLVSAVVENIVDGASVHAVGLDGKPRFVCTRHRDPVKERAVVELLQREPVSTEGNVDMLTECIRTGEPSVVQSVPDEALTAGAVDDEALKLLRTLAMGSLGVMPVRPKADGGRVGPEGAGSGPPVFAVLSFTKDAGKFVSEQDFAAIETLCNEAGGLIEQLRGGDV